MRANRICTTAGMSKSPVSKQRPRPCAVVFCVDKPTLVFSLAEAIEILGEEDGRLLSHAFKSGSGHRGIWLLPHPERDK